MALKTDTTGQLYIQMEDKEGSHVIQHVYNYPGKPELADDGYTEKVYFEIANDTESLNLKDDALKNNKLIVQKACFCSDAGYELITNGSLRLESTRKGYDVNISYNSDKELKFYELNFKLNK